MPEYLDTRPHKASKVRSCLRVSGRTRRVRYGLLARPGLTISLKKDIRQSQTLSHATGEHLHGLSRHVDLCVQK